MRGSYSGQAGRGGFSGVDGRILAGTNVTVSPSSGVGNVTVSAVTSGGAPAFNLRGPVAGDITVALTDYTVISNSAAAARAVTLPDASTTNAYQIFVVKRSGANDVTVSVDGGGTIDGQASEVLGTDGAWITVQSDGTNYRVIG